MQLSSLTALSPIDGRYRRQLEHLDDYFSEYALMKYRVLIEIEYLQFLAQKKICKLSATGIKRLNDIKKNFSVEQAESIKEIERTTNHDVKAVEYFIKNEL